MAAVLTARSQAFDEQVNLQESLEETRPLDSSDVAEAQRKVMGWSVTPFQRLQMEAGGAGTNEAMRDFTIRRVADRNKPRAVTYGIVGQNTAQNPDDVLYARAAMGKNLVDSMAPGIVSTEWVNPYKQRGMNSLGATNTEVQLYVEGANRQLPYSNLDVEQVEFDATNEIRRQGGKELTSAWALTQFDPELIRMHKAKMTNRTFELGQSIREGYRTAKNPLSHKVDKVLANNALGEGAHPFVNAGGAPGRSNPGGDPDGLPGGGLGGGSIGRTGPSNDPLGNQEGNDMDTAWGNDNVGSNEANRPAPVPYNQNKYSTLSGDRRKRVAKALEDYRGNRRSDRLAGYRLPKYGPEGKNYTTDDLIRDPATRRSKNRDFPNKDRRTDSDPYVKSEAEIKRDELMKHIKKGKMLRGREGRGPITREENPYTESVYNIATQAPPFRPLYQQEIESGVESPFYYGPHDSNRKYKV